MGKKFVKIENVWYNVEYCTKLSKSEFVKQFKHLSDNAEQHYEAIAQLKGKKGDDSTGKDSAVKGSKK
jgi:hypothetical protein